MGIVSDLIKEIKRNDSDRNYRYSIITPAYNVEDYIEETLESVYHQKWLIKNPGQVQMIIINDGSTDGTWEKLLELYPNYDNLVIINKENSGVSETRNIGAKFAKGKYWNFLDSDDKLGEEAIWNVDKIYKSNPDIQLIKMNRRYFEKYNGTPEYYMRDLKVSGIIDTREDPYHPVIHVASMFFESVLWEDNMFPKHLTYGEDAWVAGIMIEKSPKIYFSFEAVYCYRRRFSEDSLVDQHKGDPRKYIDQARDFYIAYFKYIEKRFSKISIHVQSMILYYLSWNVKSKDDYEFLTDSYKDEYFPLLTETLSHCEDEIIMGQKRLLNYYLRHTLMILKHTGRIPEDNFFYPTTVEEIKNKNVPVIRDKRDKRIERWDVRQARIIVLKSIEGNISILGSINTIFDLKFNENFRVCFENEVGERYYFAEEFLTPFKSYWFMNRILKKVVSFSANVPGDFFKDGKIKLIGLLKVNSEWYETEFSYEFTGHFSWLVNKTKGSYFPHQDKIISYDAPSKSLLVESVSSASLVKKEIAVAKNLLRRDTKESKFHILKILFWRNYANFLRKRKEKKCLTVNCYMDRHNSAWDNGTALLMEHNKNLEQNNTKNVKNYFIVDKQSAVYQELKKKGINVVPFKSFKHKRLMLIADRLISSQANITNYNPFRGIWRNKLNDKQRFEYIFLQHGVNLRKLASYNDPWMTRTKLGIDKIVATNQLEFDYLTDTNNGSEFLPENVKLTGMARHDLLNVDTKNKSKEEEKKILVMPTWRKNLSIWRGGDYMYNPAFKDSEHFKIWNSLLNNEKLFATLKEYNTKIIFAPHPLELIQIEDYDLKNVDQLIEKVSDYNQLINDTDAYITDYSSVGLDYFYANKPIFVLDTGDDYWDNFDDRISYQSGSFGDVRETVDELVDCIIDSVSNGLRTSEDKTRFRNQFYLHELNKNISHEILKKFNII